MRRLRESKYVMAFIDGMRSSLRWPTIGYWFIAGILLGLVLRLL